ncbi:unnamed protein product [Candidula unifasciata]|uniref:Uncharacterized protein n=1 Tax=Candidula unifasciata TaxID=100452 RepID=A0A8S3YTF5_9EUPU|nr:unnamed protein product [Candidula unifasciata]
MNLTDITGNPITDNRKGSLTLRATHSNYSRAVLNGEWHQARQAEPKDYDLNKDPVRSMTLSTYNRIGNITDGTLPKTTYQEQASQILLRPMFSFRDIHRSLVQPETVAAANAGIDRDTGDPKGAYGSVLPFPSADGNTPQLETTYTADYIPPYPFTRRDDTNNYEDSKGLGEKSAAFRKMKSQFTDTDDYRRNGWNTWQDESGIYTNSQYKVQLFPKTETIPGRPISN